MPGLELAGQVLVEARAGNVQADDVHPLALVSDRVVMASRETTEERPRCT